MRRVGAFIAALSAAALLLGCFGMAKQARQIRKDLIGFRARDLWNCLGDPFYVRLESKPELWAFQMPLPAIGREDVGFLITNKPGTSFKRPTTLKGNPEEGDPNKRSSLESRVPPGRCRVVAEVTNGIVRAIHFKGRTGSDMNADIECTMVAQRCLPDAAPGPE